MRIDFEDRYKVDFLYSVISLSTPIFIPMKNVTRSISRLLSHSNLVMISERIMKNETFSLEENLEERKSIALFFLTLEQLSFINPESIAHVIDF